ncbi:MAG: HU family DNA-binding protein [Zetaproteobacteria bacterium]|nr:HU family DNA-binding protein [Zetaproteobacteria bacterium]
MMNKSDLVDNLSKRLNTSKAEANNFLDVLTEVIQENLEDGVKLTGLGTFTAALRKARTARNPQTGAEIQVPEKYVPVFKPANTLKEAALEIKK